MTPVWMNAACFPEGPLMQRSDVRFFITGNPCSMVEISPVLILRVSGGADRCIVSSSIPPVDNGLPSPLEGIDEVFYLIGSELFAPRSSVLYIHDLEECVFEDLEAALHREDDLKPAEDMIRDTYEVSVDGRERENLVRGKDVSLVHRDLEDRRRRPERSGVLC
jgi:hypothetical protein